MSSARLEIGGSGPLFLSGTSASAVGQYFALQAGAAGLTISTIVGLSGFAGATLAPGSVLMFGLANVTQVTLSTGSGFLYRR